MDTIACQVATFTEITNNGWTGYSVELAGGETCIIYSSYTLYAIWDESTFEIDMQYVARNETTEYDDDGSACGVMGSWETDESELYVTYTNGELLYTEYSPYPLRDACVEEN